MHNALASIIDSTFTPDTTLLTDSTDPTDDLHPTTTQLNDNKRTLSPGRRGNLQIPRDPISIRVSAAAYATYAAYAGHAVRPTPQFAV